MMRCRPSAAARLAFLVAGLVAAPASAQVVESAGLVPTGLLLRQMDGVKRVLMIGAHPDDEDTAFLTAMARTWGAETAYLSITRGDGGQNLIGPELWEGLGVIRTGELEAARRIDGGQQFFTRAFDFGYSKTAEEALTFWQRDEVLADVVWVIRTFRPHVIVSVWSGTPRDGHGQHQASGILAREGYEASGDPGRFAEQFALGVEPWQASKYFVTVRRNPSDATVTLDAGRLDPLLGRSAYQISRLSRSQHRSQDMGVAQPMGPRNAAAALVHSRVGGGADQGIFDGIDTTLVGVAADVPADVRSEVEGHLTAYREALTRARRDFGLDTEALVADLREALHHLRSAAAAAGEGTGTEFRAVMERRLDLASRALLSAAGIVVDLRAADDLVVPGQTVNAELLVWNGDGAEVGGAEVDVTVPDGWSVEVVGVDGLTAVGGIAPGALARWRLRIHVPEDADLSRLYYLRAPREGHMYRWPDDPSVWGLPRDPAPVHADVRLTFPESSAVAAVDRPWRYVGVDQARGEFYKPVLVAPAVSVFTTPGQLVWPQVREEPAVVTVAIRNDAPGGAEGTVRLDAPAGWAVSPEEHPISLDGEGSVATVAFEVQPEGVPQAGDQRFRAVVRLEDDQEYDEGAALVDYEHIERALLFHDAEARFTVVPVVVADGLRVGYVMGTGDQGPEAIRQLGAQVDVLDETAVRAGAYDAYDVVVLGVRAYETRPDLRAANQQLLDYARAGGVVVVQYNQYQFARGDYAPYPLNIGRPAPRVADETAPVTILEPEAPVFTTPNRITQADFDGWSQERGLYFLSEWDDAYLPLLEMNDPGEPPRRGSLLVAPVGDGLYVYAALSFFRQFPTGVPGAYRLFANLISLRPDAWAEYLARREGR